MPDSDILIQMDERLRSMEQEVAVIGTRMETLFTVGKYALMLVGASLGIDLLPMLGGL